MNRGTRPVLGTRRPSICFRRLKGRESRKSRRSRKRKRRRRRRRKSGGRRRKVETKRLQRVTGPAMVCVGRIMNELRTRRREQRGRVGQSDRGGNYLFFKKTYYIFDTHRRLGWSNGGEVDKQMQVSARTRGEGNLSRTPRRASPIRLKRFQEIVEELTRVAAKVILVPRVHT